MSNFDPIVFNAIKQINLTGGSNSGSTREPGELAIVPKGFTSSNYLDVGAYIDQSTYPTLYSCFAGAFHLGDYAESTSLPARYMTVNPSLTQTGMVKHSSGDLYAVDTTQTRFVRSTDGGQTWVLHSTPTNFPTGFVWGSSSGFYFSNNAFYVGITLPTATLVYQSSDAITWTLISTTSTTAAQYYKMANGVHFILNSGSSASMLTSPDGITWTARTLPAASTWVNPVYANSTYLVVNAAGATVATSTDLITWTSRTTPATLYFSRAFAGLFVVFSASATATYYTSPDGITWTPHTLPASVTYSGSVVTSDTIYFIPNSGTTGYSSPDGINWTNRTLPVTTGNIAGFPDAVNVLYWTGSTMYLTSDKFVTAPSYTMTIQARTCQWSMLAASPSAIVAYEANTTNATDNYVYRSADRGATWTAVQLPVTAKVTALQYVAPTSTFFAILAPSSNGFLVSTDQGTTWTQKFWPAFASTATNATLLNKSDTTKLTVNVYSGTYNQVLTTTTGNDITPAYMGSSSIGNLPATAAIFQNRAYMYATSNLYIVPLARDINAILGVQTNASTTLPTALTTSFTWGPMAASKEIMVVLPASTTAPSSTFGYTTDGQNWTAGTLPFAGSWADVIWNGKCFVAVSAPLTANTNNAYSELRLIYSFDGMNWDVYDFTSKFDVSTDIGALHQSFVFTGSDGTVYVTLTNHSRVVRFDVTDSIARVPYIPAPSPATKYVVRAK